MLDLTGEDFEGKKTKKTISKRKMLCKSKIIEIIERLYNMFIYK